MPQAMVPIRHGMHLASPNVRPSVENPLIRIHSSASIFLRIGMLAWLRRMLSVPGIRLEPEMGFELLLVGRQAHVILALANPGDNGTVERIGLAAFGKDPRIFLELLPELLLALLCHGDMLAVRGHGPGDEPLRLEPFEPARCGLLADRKHCSDTLGRDKDRALAPAPECNGLEALEIFCGNHAYQN